MSLLANCNEYRPNGDALRKCILSGPYKSITVLVQAVAATDDSLAIPEHTTVKTPMNMSSENKAHFHVEKEAIHLILTGIGDEMYSIVDAFQTAQEMWEAIKMLQQGESLNIQDVKTNLFWEFGKFTSHDGETMKSYYTIFYKLMNEMIQNNLTVATMQVNVQLLQQHQLEWSRKPKRVKDSVYRKEKMLLCKQAEQGVPLQAEQYDWLADTDEEINEHELEAHYNYMEKIQEQLKKANTTLAQELKEGKTILAETMATDDGNVIFDSPDTCNDDIQNEQNDLEIDEEHVALANLISNLKLDVDGNKKIQKQLKKANTTLAQELKEGKTILAETSKSLGESDSVWDSCLVALQTKQTEFEKYKAFNDRTFAPILGYGDLVQGNVTINRVYYVEGLNHNLFSVGQFSDADLEVAFQKSTCFIRDLQGNGLLIGNHGSDLYTISLQESTSSTPLFLMAKASPTQAWLWHRRLSHINFDYINLLSKKDIMISLPKLKYVKDQLCSSCELSKEKRSSFKSKAVLSIKGRLNLLHMDLCGPMRVASINGKKYILVIVDDYSRYTWTLFLRSKDETLEVLKEFFTMIQRNLQALVITVRTDRGTEFLNKTLNAFFKEEGIEHQNSTARTPEQNGVVERRNHTDAHVPSQQELDLLFGPLYDEFFNASSNPQDIKSTTNIQPTSAPSTPTYVHAEENNDNQVEEEHLQNDEFTNPL
nr:retrovirus-related Pol polyprotein from transposon TNT 1-94 [Tanacetum cinerariifolium]